jgi:hypothetical protein
VAEFSNRDLEQIGDVGSQPSDLCLRDHTRRRDGVDPVAATRDESPDQRILAVDNIPFVVTQIETPLVDSQPSAKDNAVIRAISPGAIPAAHIRMETA